MFDEVWVINLKRRGDRLAAFRSHPWPWDVKVFEAVDRDIVLAPPAWPVGAGAWACQRSHVNLLESCLMREVGNVLVLEDDAEPTAGFAEALPKFLANVPSDWDGLMLGGQHIVQPLPVGEGIERVAFATRTHAYAARGNYLRELYHQFATARGHIDHALRGFAGLRKVYSPSPWIVTQSAGKSDISGRNNPAGWLNKSA